MKILSRKERTVKTEPKEHGDTEKPKSDEGDKRKPFIRTFTAARGCERNKYLK